MEINSDLKNPLCLSQQFSVDTNSLERIPNPDVSLSLFLLRPVALVKCVQFGVEFLLDTSLSSGTAVASHESLQGCTAPFGALVAA